MSVPAWFDEATYLKNKVYQLNSIAWQDKTDWTTDSFLAELAKYEATPYEHFVAQGNAENVSPNGWFNVAEYLKAKAEQMNAENYKERTDWTEASVLEEMNSFNVSAWEHYTLVGQFEGVNPSNSFDTSAYFDAKATLLNNAAWEGRTDWTAKDIQEIFREAGINPIMDALAVSQDQQIGNPSVPADEQVTTNFNPYAPAVSGQNLTTDEDHLVGTDGDDMFNGVSSALSAEKTLNPQDTIDGGSGNDTLNVTLNANFTGFAGTEDGKASVVNVENVVLTNEGSIMRNFSAKNMDGVTTWTLKDKGAAINLSDLAEAGITVNMEGLQKGSTTLGFTADAVKGDTDTLILGLNGIGTAKTDTAKAQYVAVTAKGIENLTINATGDNYADLSGAASKSISVSGAGNLDVEGVNSKITSFDASAASGKVTADLSGVTKLETLKGGAGDDTFTVANLAPTAVVDGGAGNDTLVFKNVTGTLQPKLSGFETIEANGGSLTISGKNVADFTSLNLKGGTQVTLADMQISDFTVNDYAGTNEVTLADAMALTYNSVASADAVADQKAEDVTADLTAGKATTATVNVSEYTALKGTLTFAAATDVVVNVASAKNAQDIEQTSFAATLTAAKAQSLTVNAQGALAGGSFTVDEAASIVLDAAQGSSAAVKFDASKATDVSISSGKALDLTGSDFSSAQEVTVVQDDGALKGTLVLGAVNQLTVSGSGADSAATFGNLGSNNLEYDVNLNISGMAKGFAAGTVDTGAGNSVNVDATVLGGFTLGAVTVKDDSEKTGSINMNLNAAGAIEIGALSAKDIVIDASQSLSTVGKTTAVSAAADSVTFSAGLGDSQFTVTEAKTVTLTGNIGIDTFTATVSENATIDGGVGNDQISVTLGASGDTVTAILTGGAGEDTFDVKKGGQGVVTITDFTDGTDELTFTHVAFGSDESTAKTNASTWLEVAFGITADEEDLSFADSSFKQLRYNGNLYLVDATAQAAVSTIVELVGVTEEVTLS